MQNTTDPTASAVVEEVVVADPGLGPGGGVPVPGPGEGVTGPSLGQGAGGTVLNLGPSPVTVPEIGQSPSRETTRLPGPSRGRLTGGDAGQASQTGRTTEPGPHPELSPLLLFPAKTEQISGNFEPLSRFRASFEISGLKSRIGEFILARFPVRLKDFRGSFRGSG